MSRGGLAAARPSGSISQARVMDLASAAQDVLDDRRLDPAIPWGPWARGEGRTCSQRFR
jgi:hypothetical protein